jgi:predicted nucleic acid-binding protein
MRLFLDINVLLDVLANREPWVTDSTAVLSLLEGVDVEGFMAANTVTTLCYLASKHLGRASAAQALVGLMEHVSVTPLDEDLLLRALSLGWNDVEDAVQELSAQRAGADYLVTRNPSDFKASVLRVVTPTQLLAILGPAEVDPG